MCHGLNVDFTVYAYVVSMQNTCIMLDVGIGVGAYLEGILVHTHTTHKHVHVGICDFFMFAFSPDLYFIILVKVLGFCCVIHYQIYSLLSYLSRMK